MMSPASFRSSGTSSGIGMSIMISLKRALGFDCSLYRDSDRAPLPLRYSRIAAAEFQKFEEIPMRCEERSPSASSALQSERSDVDRDPRMGIQGNRPVLVACDLRNRPYPVLSNRSETRIACPNAFPSGGIDHTSIRERHPLPVCPFAARGRPVDEVGCRASSSNHSDDFLTSLHFLSPVRNAHRVTACAA